MQARLIMAGIALITALGIGLTIFFMHMQIKNLTLERDAAQKQVIGYKTALEAYQDGFKNQMKTLSIEKQQEIKRQENLLATLNLIGDIENEENKPVDAAVLRIIGSMYGPDAGAAADRDTGSP